MNLALLNDEKHACWGILLKNVLTHFRLVRVHRVRQFLPFEFAQLEKKKMFAYCLLDEFEVLRGLWPIDFLDVLENFLCWRSSMQSFELVLFLAGVVVDRHRGNFEIRLAVFNHL